MQEMFLNLQSAPVKGMSCLFDRAGWTSPRYGAHGKLSKGCRASSLVVCFSLPVSLPPALGAQLLQVGFGHALRGVLALGVLGIVRVVPEALGDRRPRVDGVRAFRA